MAQGPQPRRHIAVVACMDARVDPLPLLGLDVGDANVIRNAGGVVTDDVIRSLSLSQRRLKTTEVVLIHHTDCGLEGLDEDAFVAELASAAGSAPGWPIEAFTNPYASVGESMHRIDASPYLLHIESVRGYVFDVESLVLNEVERVSRS